MKKETTLNNCKFVKTVLMLLVILGHSLAFWHGDWFIANPAIESNSISIFYSWIGSFHIYAFTLVSGYIFAFKIFGGGYANYPQFKKNKAKRLLVPYVFVMLIWVLPISQFYFKWDIISIIKKYVLCINPSQLWFLWMLFDVFAMVWVLRNLMIKKPLMGWIISLAFYGIGIVGGHFIPNVFCIWTACQYVVFFFIGMRIRVKSENRERLITETVPWYCWVLVDLLLFVADKWVETHNGFIWSVISIGLSFLLHLVGSIMTWSFLQMLASHVHWQDSKVFKTLASYSMPMYLFHQQIIYFTITALNGIVNPWINAGVNFVAAVVGSFIISAILMRWEITRILIGENIRRNKGKRSTL